ncbi:MAG TPA: hypothetical protein VMH04_19130 [Candidatus Solibacter sp.]|nr:hypothetical protein [Candidatus Solibacter sp.]
MSVEDRAKSADGIFWQMLEVDLAVAAAVMAILISLFEEKKMSVVASTTIISNLKNVTARTSNTVVAGNTAGIDRGGMLALALTKALELKACLTILAQATDASDPNLSTINNVLASLV